VPDVRVSPLQAKIQADVCGIAAEVWIPKDWVDYLGLANRAVWSQWVTAAKAMPFERMLQILARLGEAHPDHARRVLAAIGQGVDHLEVATRRVEPVREPIGRLRHKLQAEVGEHARAVAEATDPDSDSGEDLSIEELDREDRELVDVIAEATRVRAAIALERSRRQPRQLTLIRNAEPAPRRTGGARR
jgi:hypothetical protein